METTVKDGYVIIKLKLLKDPVLSKSEKSYIIATSNGIQSTGIKVNKQAVSVGVNLFIKNKKYRDDA